LLRVIIFEIGIIDGILIMGLILDEWHRR